VDAAENETAGASVAVADETDETDEADEADEADELPAIVDWREKGVIPMDEIGYQGECGNCYAWSVKHVAEAAWRIAGNNFLPLSVQHVTDCSMDSNNMGCDGGNPDSALEVIRKRGGFCLSYNYPFAMKPGPCKPCQIAAQITNITTHYGKSEEFLKQLVAKSPVAVAINAPASFKAYMGGVYDDPECNPPTETVVHSVTVVGYGTDSNDGDYWIIKNQWSKTWGERGYARIRRGKSRCYITVEVTSASSAPSSTFGLPNLPTPPDVSTTFEACKTKSANGQCMAMSSCHDLGGVSITRAKCNGTYKNVVCCMLQNRKL